MDVMEDSAEFGGPPGQRVIDHQVKVMRDDLGVPIDGPPKRRLDAGPTPGARAQTWTTAAMRIDWRDDDDEAPAR